MCDVLKAPFPWFGGKSRVASLVWDRLGDVDNYVEPFAGSAAMLLLRPSAPKVETLNDMDCYVANFWRATGAAPGAVASFADWPVNEADLHARHRWLVLSEPAAEFRKRMRTEPDYFDAKIAGWWCWGLCCWIGGGWCADPDSPTHGPAGGSGERRPMIASPHSEHGRGVHGEAKLSQQVPYVDRGAGRGMDAAAKQSRPQLADTYARGRGVHGNDAAGSCEQRRAWLLDWFGRLRDRLRTVRVCCGHWLRVCDSDSVTVRLGTTGVFLDPPYPTHKEGGEASRSGDLYANDRQDLNALRDEVLAWCRERGPDKRMRIAVCGYDSDGYQALESEGWECVAWKAQGGYANRGGKNENAGRERVWFSPHCRSQRTLFDGLGDAA